MSPINFCNFNFLMAILALIIDRCDFYQSASADEINGFAMKSTPISLPLPKNSGQQCSSIENGISLDSMTFNVDFYFENLNYLLNDNNGRMSFFICYKSSLNENLMKAQFKLKNNLENEIEEYCSEDGLHGFEIDFIKLDEQNQIQLCLEFSISEQKWNFTFGEKFLFNRTKLKLKFDQNSIQLFHGYDHKMANKIFQLGEGRFKKYFLYNGNKMMQKNVSPWFILMDIAVENDEEMGNKNSMNLKIPEQHFQIHHQNVCSILGNDKEMQRSIQIECIKICEFGPLECECGKHCRCPAKKHPITFISGGDEVNDPKKWPWLVAVHSNFSVTKNGANMEIGPFQCSGSIIHEEYLLTAAHCVKKIDKEYSWALSKIVIFAGQTNIKNSELQILNIPPENVFPNDQFDDIITIERNYNFEEINLDIALIKLPNPLKFNEKINSICLFEDLKINITENIHMAGWGFSQEVDFNPTEGSDENLPDVEDNLHETKAKIIPIKECLKYESANCLVYQEEIFNYCLKSKEKIFESRFCVQGQNYSTLQKGDSGSALMFNENGRWFNIGVASKQFLRNSPSQNPLPVVFIKINKKICEWIYEKSEGKVKCQKKL